MTVKSQAKCESRAHYQKDKRTIKYGGYCYGLNESGCRITAGHIAEHKDALKKSKLFRCEAVIIDKNKGACRNKGKEHTECRTGDDTKFYICRITQEINIVIHHALY